MVGQNHEGLNIARWSGSNVPRGFVVSIVVIVL